jgi:hypothetical protein
MDAPDLILALGRLVATLGMLVLLATGVLQHAAGEAIAALVAISNGAGLTGQAIHVKRNGNGNGH